jgi:hypothetical protein
MTLYTWEQWGPTPTLFSDSAPIVLWTCADDWGQSLFQWGGGWYVIGTISTHRPKQAEGFRHISVKLCKANDFPYTKANNSPHIQTQLFTLHSNTSNPHNAWCSRSVPPITVSTLVFYATYLSLIIFKIILHPMTLLIAFPLQVIIFILFYTTYYHLLTVTLLICCLIVISQAPMPILPIV